MDPPRTQPPSTTPAGVAAPGAVQPKGSRSGEGAASTVPYVLEAILAQPRAPADIGMSHVPLPSVR